MGNNKKQLQFRGFPYCPALSWIVTKTFAIYGAPANARNPVRLTSDGVAGSAELRKSPQKTGHSNPTQDVAAHFCSFGRPLCMASLTKMHYSYIEIYLAILGLICPFWVPCARSLTLNSHLLTRNS
jgi:hypothetical protein